jgi:hypothetical protein
MVAGRGAIVRRLDIHRAQDRANPKATAGSQEVWSQGLTQQAWLNKAWLNKAWLNKA